MQDFLEYEVENNIRLNNINIRLREAIYHKNKEALIKAFEDSYGIDLSAVDNDIFHEYAELYQQANKIIIL